MIPLVYTLTSGKKAWKTRLKPRHGGDAKTDGQPPLSRHHLHQAGQPHSVPQVDGQVAHVEIELVCPGQHVQTPTHHHHRRRQGTIMQHAYVWVTGLKWNMYVFQIQSYNFQKCWLSDYVLLCTDITTLRRTNFVHCCRLFFVRRTTSNFAEPLTYVRLHVPNDVSHLLEVPHEVSLSVQELAEHLQHAHARLHLTQRQRDTGGPPHIGTGVRGPGIEIFEVTSKPPRIANKEDGTDGVGMHGLGSLVACLPGQLGIKHRAHSLSRKRSLDIPRRSCGRDKGTDAADSRPAKRRKTWRKT